VPLCYVAHMRTFTTHVRDLHPVQSPPTAENRQHSAPCTLRLARGEGVRWTWRNSSGDTDVAYVTRVQTVSIAHASILLIQTGLFPQVDRTCALTCVFAFQFVSRYSPVLTPLPPPASS
jgi:hypothetical protein